MSPRAALDILDPVLQALGAAHSAGLVHRDVKPENVILREDGAVKVADFGLARAIATTTSTAQTGVLLGTVAYLSPEQVERGVADARSDVYAAGLLLFEMLTGSKAYIGDSPIHVAYQHVHSEVPLPSSRVGTVPARLDHLVVRASERDPDNRPRDANELLAEVRRSRQTLSAAELDQQPAVPSGALNQTMAISRTTMVPEVTSSTGGAASPTGRRWARPGRRPPGDRSGRTRLLVLVALALVVAAAATLFFFMVGPGANAAVPKIVGSTATAAQEALAAAQLKARVVTSFDETVRAGMVLAGAPPAGRVIRRGSTVTMTVSRGPERYAVPRLVGRTQAEAAQRVSDARLTVGRVRAAYSERVPQGQVISTTPAAGTSVKRSTPVALLISRGRQPIKVVDWTGKQVDKAVAALTAANLKVDATRQDWSSTVPKGSVISQSPATGTAFKGDQVTLVASRGPKLIAVPNVIGRQEGPARAILQRLGFEVKVTRALGGFFRTVRLQSVPAGTSAPRGSTITLTVV